MEPEQGSAGAGSWSARGSELELPAGANALSSQQQDTAGAFTNAST